MANQLGVAKINSILTLHEQGHSCRRIAALLGVHRETVARYLRQARAPADPAPAKPATAPTGSAAGQNASVAGGACPGRMQSDQRRMDESADAQPTASDCEPWRPEILLSLQRGLSAMRIHQDLSAQHGQVTPSYYSVRRFIRQLRGEHPLPYRRIESAPGVDGQVDFGKGAPVVQPNGRRRRTHVLRIVLSFSRRGYSEAVYRQTTDDFLRCLENAFWHFGGVPQTLTLDNLRAAVSQADWFDPQINPKVQSFCEHYGTVALPTKPRTPRHKGKVERGIAYVQDNGLKGHVFSGLQEQNRHLLQWETHVADTRIHGTTKRQVREVFEQIERPALRPLPAAGRFAFFQEAQRVVHRDGHVEVAKAYYSVPPEYLGRRLWVRWDAHVVRIFDPRMQPIAVHARREEGRFSTQDSHIASAKINSIERGAVWLLQKVSRIGIPTQRWAEAMVQERGIEGVRVLQGLISLAGKYPSRHIDDACEIALSHGAFRLRTLRQLIQRRDQVVRQDLLPGFLDEHPIIRSLSDYGRLVHTALTHESITESHP